MKVFLLIILLTLLTIDTAFAQSANSILGTWVNQQGTALIKISTHENTYQGNIIGSPDKQHRKDKHNPDPKLRNRPLLDVQVMGGLIYKSNNTWEDGWIYDPENGKTFGCNLSLKNADTLEIRVFKGTPMFGKTIIWKRKN